MHKKLYLLLFFVLAGHLARAQTFGPFVITATTSPCASVDVGTGNSTVGITVKGTFSMTLQPSVSNAGQSADNIQVTPSTSSTAQSTITAAGSYKPVGGVAGYSLFQICPTAVVSGTATIYLKLSNGPIATLPTPAGGSGTVTSVLGTANQITSDGNTATPTLSLPSVLTLPGTINKLTLTAPATGATLTLADGKTLTSSNTLTLAGTDGSTLNVSTGGTLTALAFTSPGTGGATALANAINATGGTLVLTGALVSGGALYASSTSAVQSSALLAANGCVFGGGAGTAPSTNSNCSFSGGTLTLGSNGGSSGVTQYNGSSSGTPTFGCAAAACTTLTSSVSVTATKYVTSGNCSSSASPAVCSSFAAGTVALPTGTNPTLQVNTTAVTANSIILLTVDESLGTKLSVTCNTTLSTLLNPVVTARTGGTSFTFTIGAVIATNPACVSYEVIN